ncbi:unnamed protein product, partial [Scytosiphon promiscuus]
HGLTRVSDDLRLDGTRGQLSHGAGAGRRQRRGRRRVRCGGRARGVVEDGARAAAGGRAAGRAEGDEPEGAGGAAAGGVDVRRAVVLFEHEDAGPADSEAVALARLDSAGPLRWREGCLPAGGVPRPRSHAGGGG